jgi:hypothetical protein
MLVQRRHSHLHTLESICTYLFCHGKMNVEDICQTLLHIWVTRQFPVLIINGIYLPFSSTWVQPPPPTPGFLVGFVLLLFLMFCVVLFFILCLFRPVSCVSNVDSISRVLCVQCWQYIPVSCVSNVDSISRVLCVQCWQYIPCPVCPMLTVHLDCPFLIVPSVFSNV